MPDQYGPINSPVGNDPRLYGPQNPIASESANSREKAALAKAIEEESAARRAERQPPPAAKGAKLVGKGGAKVVEGQNGGVVEAGAGGGNQQGTFVTYDVAFDGDPTTRQLLTL